MAITVRSATGLDADLLHTLAAATFALACPPGTTAESITDFIATHLSAARFTDYLADSERQLLIAERDGDPAGYTMLVFTPPADSDVRAALTVTPSAELSKLYVLADAHGGGVAAPLMAASVEAARLRGFAAVWLGVNQLNERANRFYEKQGFVCVGTKKFLVGGTYEDDFVRERIL